MSRTKAARRREKRKPVDRAERIGPTPETAAKLEPDAFDVLVRLGILDTAQRDAGLEIRAIWYAITGSLLARAGERSGTRSGNGMSDTLAVAHALVYVPWCDRWGRAVADVIDLVVDARLEGETLARITDLLMLEKAAGSEGDRREYSGRLGLMLTDYARRRRAMPRLKAA